MRARTYLTAYALPGDAQLDLADGTQVVTDIIILRKRSEPLKEMSERPAWVEAQDTTVLHDLLSASGWTACPSTWTACTTSDPGRARGRSGRGLLWKKGAFG